MFSANIKRNGRLTSETKLFPHVFLLLRKVTAFSMFRDFSRKQMNVGPTIIYILLFVSQVMAGKLKRADPNMVEDVTLIRALRDRYNTLSRVFFHSRRFNSGTMNMNNSCKQNGLF